MHILDEIVERKKLEVKDLYSMYSIEQMKKDARPSEKSFYDSIRNKRDKGEHFFITEFKRKSPSEGEINYTANPTEQIDHYISMGSNAISVLTDHHYFGGTYDDLGYISDHVKDKDICVLQKDFIIDPIQIYLARLYGANLILLITRILTREAIIKFKEIAESLNMGVLLEIHDEKEYDKVKGIDIQVIGINNRDLDTFITRLNHFNHTSEILPKDTVLVTESGINLGTDIRVCSNKANAYLIGTALMKGNFKQHLTNYLHQPILKCCGIRSAENLKGVESDFIGINFSPISKRKVDVKAEWLKELPMNSVGVFKDQSEEEILSIQKELGLKYIQVYLKDISEDFLKQVKCKVILAHTIATEEDLKQVKALAPLTDLLILDGPFPGSGKSINIEIPEDFNFPFLMAGGINIETAEKALSHPMCIGVDLASGIETDGNIDYKKVKDLQSLLNTSVA